MNEQLTCELKGNILFMETKGIYSPQELQAFFIQSMHNPQLPPRFAIVIDARQSRTSISMNEIKPLSAELKTALERIVCIATVVHSKLHYGLTRQAGTFHEHYGFETRPYYDMESAIAWVKEKLAYVSSHNTQQPF
ncbi:MAG: hypothetical protein JXK94_14515 [Deltaproteobacteria bacterium]|nr:hypothetical protein [Deltaproteobacteria bacterium]